MVNWFCKNCPATGQDCGPWDDEYRHFVRIKSVHNKHDGFQIGEPELAKKQSEIEQMFTDCYIENIDEIVHSVNAKLIGPDKVCLLRDKPRCEENDRNILDSIVKECSKEIKEEENNIKQVILTLLSAWTINPQNTRILSPSGEGKTYLVEKISRLFPQENMIILAKATPQSFKYALSAEKVVEIKPGKFENYEEVVKPLEIKFKNTKDTDEKISIAKEIEKLKNSSYELVDFSNKTIILVDSQSYELFESVKTTLSHDLKDMKSLSVNKSGSGTLLGQKFLFRGFPAMIYCSAKDEQQLDSTNEINTRFNTISLNASVTKYRKMLEHEALCSSLPDSIFQEEVISEKEIQTLKEKISYVIKEVQKYSNCWNPYGLEIQNLFKDDAGFRTRQLKIVNSNIRIHTIVNARFRPKIIHSGITVPVSNRLDIEEACRLLKEPREIQPYKIKFFNENIRKAILEAGKEKSLVNGNCKCLTASEIADYLTKKGITTDRQRLQETLLKPLAVHGFLEEFIDPENKSRYIYALAHSFLENPARLESTLIDTSLLDCSCIDSFITKFIEQRFTSGVLKILDERNNEISPIVLSEILHEVDVHIIKNRHRITTVETPTAVDISHTDEDIQEESAS